MYCIVCYTVWTDVLHVVCIVECVTLCGLMYCMLYVLWSVLHCVDCDVLHVVCIVKCVTLCGLMYCMLYVL